MPWTDLGRGSLTRASLHAGLLAGALDIAAAIAVGFPTPARVILQAVASGWLGREAFRGGWPTAWLGLASHFAIMLVIAAVFVAMAARYAVLRRLWIPAGVVFGIAVWLAMAFIVVPLSASPLQGPADLTAALKRIVIHVLFVGLPITWVARRILGDGRA